MSAVVSPPAADSPAAIAAAAPSEAAQAQLDKLLSTLVFEPTGTTATEAAAAKASWLANAQTQAGEIGLITANPSSVTLDSNIRLCVENPPVNGLVGILVNPEGAIVSEPKLLKSTGYANLNQAALNAARRSSFEAADQFAAYEVTINVSYDAEACVEPEQALQTPAE
jgi:TonB family protein